MKPIIFLGPTLPVGEAQQRLDAEYCPPVELGDVWRAALRHPPAIGIVDGYFDRVPAVWHKEILWALAEGIPVFGSASMGALRAAELADFGMTGVGAIFSAYREGELEDDDEVALVHTDGPSGFQPLSEPMVNIRATLAAAEREGVVPPGTRTVLESAAKSLFYAERIWPALLRKTEANDISSSEIDALAAWLPEHRVDQKRTDALEMLEAIGEQLSAKRPVPPLSFRFEATSLWRELTLTEAPISEEAAAVLDELRLDAALYSELRGVVLTRWEREGLSLALLEEAHRTGAYQRLATRARQKAAFLAQHRRLASSALPDPDSLLHWLFETRLGGWPEDFPSFLRERGWTDESRLVDTALRDYLFVHADV